MIKRTVGLRPIKYAKLPSHVTVGLFNSSVYEKKALADAFSKLNKSSTIIEEKDMWKNWEKGDDVTNIDFVLLFSHIPHNELKDIWYITGCDKIMKFASFNRIYNQCVYGQDILWINCKTVEHIEQKIRWDKLTLSIDNTNVKKKSEREQPKEIEPEPQTSLKISTPPMLPNEFTTVRVPTPSRATSEVIQTDQQRSLWKQEESLSSSPPDYEDSPRCVSQPAQTNATHNVVHVTDTSNDTVQTWVVNLPKKIVTLDVNEINITSPSSFPKMGAHTEGSKSSNLPAGTCAIL